MDKIEKVLRKIEAQTRQIFLPIVGRKKGALLEFIVRKHRPARILEIGTLVGYSAILMARNLKQGEIICIEINPVVAEVARENFKNAGLKNVKVVIGDALEILPYLKGRFDFILLDAVKEEYLDYLKTLEKYKKIDSGCVIFADDAKIFAEVLSDYLKYVRRGGKYESKYYDFESDGVEVSVKI